MTDRTERERADRRAKAMELHLAGLSYSQIAAQLDTSKSRAHEMVQQALADAAPTPPPAGVPADVANTELARLDAMLSGLWPKARKGDVAAVDRVLKIEERRAQIVTRLRMPAPPPQEEDQPDEGVPQVADIAAARARRLADAEGRSPS